MESQTERHINPGWAGHPDEFLQVNPGWAGHPDRFLQVNTLLLYISLLALTHRQNDRGRNKLILVELGKLWFLQFNPDWDGHSAGFLQINPGWAG
jgi:hypothetical protein